MGRPSTVIRSDTKSKRPRPRKCRESAGGCDGPVAEKLRYLCCEPGPIGTPNTAATAGPHLETEHCCFLHSLYDECTLFIIHMTVLFALGVDLCTDLRSINYHLHVIICTIAVVIASIQMALRTLSTRTLRANLLASELSLSPDDNVTVYAISRMTSSMKTILTVFGVGSICFNVLAFLLFFLVLHLGWTLISTNFFILLFGHAHRRVLELIRRRAKTNDDDTHRVVLYEAAHLLSEQFSACVGAPTQSNVVDVKSVYVRRVQKFLAALKFTPFYFKPDHIKLEDATEASNLLNSNQISCV